jgi:pimeloyl-ACP methyl ester carboxylesterase
VKHEDYGDGPAVVLMHGWPVTAQHWRHLIPALLGAAYRVLPVTLPGLGDRGAVDSPLDKVTLAHQVRDLLVARHAAPAVLVGHDWGGTVAYLVAADAPEVVAGVVIEEEIPPGVDVDLPEPGLSHYPNWHGPFLRAPDLAESLVPGREDALYRAFLTQSAGPAGLDPDIIDGYVAAYADTGRLAATMGYYRSHHDDAAAVRRRATRPLAVPVVTVGGGYGMGHAVHDAFTRLADQVAHIQVDNAGHYPLEQHPPITAELALRLPHPVGPLD